MLIVNNLKDKEFLGKILPDLDNKIQGRYKINIPSLMPHIPSDQGIWCKNHTHNWRVTNSDHGEYGQYFPLHSGTYVVVKFYDNDSNSGYIDRVVSDYIENSNMEGQDCTTKIPIMSDRDEQYILFKTPKKWNIFYVNEDTENEPNTIYLVYNRDSNNLKTSDIGRRTVFRIDESGMTFWTRDNNRVRIMLDDNKQVDGNQTEYIKGYRTKHIDDDDDLHVHNNQTYNIDKDQNYWVKGNQITTVDGDVNDHIKQNKIQTIDVNEDKHVKGNHIIKIDGNGDMHISGNSTINILGNSTISTTGVTNVFNTGPVNIFSSVSCSINAPSISLNSGATNPGSVPAAIPQDSADSSESKPNTSVRDIGPNETTEYNYIDQDIDGRPIITGNKCDNTTTDYNNEFRETLSGKPLPE